MKQYAQTLTRRELHEDTVDVLRGRLRSGYETALLGVQIQHSLPGRSRVDSQMALTGSALPEKLLFDSVRFQVGGLTELAGVYPVKNITLPETLDCDAVISATWNAETAVQGRRNWPAMSCRGMSGPARGQR